MHKTLHVQMNKKNNNSGKANPVVAKKKTILNRAIM